jgi:DnaJ-class molecular chaperone
MTDRRPLDEDDPGAAQTGETICPKCGGDGKLDGQPCDGCGGTGKITAIVGDA